MTVRPIDHTADLGIQVFASTLEELFTSAASALFERITDIRQLTGSKKKLISLSGMDRSDLLVNWLRELLYLWHGEKILIKYSTIETITDHQVSGSAYFDCFDPQIHEIDYDIKAVTYHQATVEKTTSGWVGQVIFDV